MSKDVYAQRHRSYLAWSRASVFNDALCLSDYCLVPVVGDVMGFCLWLFVEGFEEKRGVERRGIEISV